MDYKKCAADILHYIGGEKNIVNLESIVRPDSVLL